MNKVEKSGELRRIAALPRRVQPPEGTGKLSKVLGTGTLRPIQAQALAELCCIGGLFGVISVGGGKTLISFLASTMVNATNPLLLIPAKLRGKTLLDFNDLHKIWPIAKEPHIRSYEWLGRKQAAHWLNTHEPDLIIADEAHKLKNCDAAVTRRVGRYMNDHKCRFVALSGTMTQRSIMDYAHILEWCLGLGSPIPLTRYDLEQWAMALDEHNQWNVSVDPGALLELEPGVPDVREVYRRRLVQTPGVVASSTKGVNASLVITRWRAPKDEKIQKALRHLQDTWETPDGQPLISAVDVWRHAREISQGFWYRWKNPPPDRWLEARRNWASFARGVLSRSRSLDSEAQVAEQHSLSQEWQDWAKVKDTYTPETVAEWITTKILDAAVVWAAKNIGIVWVEHVVVGEMLDCLGLSYYGRMGINAQGQPIELCRKSCAASIAANSEGRNLQHYAYNLVLAPPTTGSRWEQLLGRTHREGQKADEVDVEVHLGCHQMKQGFWQAVSDAEYQKGTLGSEQKLLLADIGVEREH